MSYDVLPPAGVSPAAAWEPVTVAPPAAPLGLLADAIGVDGELLSLTRRVHPVDAAIAEQFRLRIGTGVAVQDQGQGFRRIEYVTDATPRQLEDEARRVLAPFIERGHARLVKITPAEIGEDGAQVTITYRNLMTGKDEGVQVA